MNCVNCGGRITKDGCTCTIPKNIWADKYGDTLVFPDAGEWSTGTSPETKLHIRDDGCGRDVKTINN
jgi:hypothetical protein